MIPAVYADSGGSGGGFVIDESPGGGGSYGSDYSGSSSYDYSQPTDYSSGGSGSSSSGSGGGVPLSTQGQLILLVVMGSIFALFWLIPALLTMKARFSGKRRYASRLFRLVHVRLAFNLLRTRDLRDGIEGLVRGADVKTTAGLTAFALALAELLLAGREHVEYAFGSVEGDIDVLEGQGRFQALTGDARAYYKREVIRRGAAGLVETTRNSPKATELLDEDGTFGIDEFFVVSLIVCTKSPKVPITEAGVMFPEVIAVLESILGIPRADMAGCEVIWTPAADSDILTRDELLTGFPELMPV